MLKGRSRLVSWTLRSALILIPSLVSNAADGDLVWARQFISADDVLGRAIEVDDAGNIYVAGQFEGTADFDPGPGVVEFTSNGSVSGFIGKLDSSGELVWINQLASTFSARYYSLVLDAAGNVYAVGEFRGTADFDPGPAVANLSSVLTSVFVSKLDHDGNLLWARNITDDSNYWSSHSIAVDSSANVYVAGTFFGTVDFDPGPGTTAFTTFGQTDIGVLKLDSAGDFVWARQMGGSDYDLVESLSPDTSGNVYTTGYFYGTSDFDPGTGTALLTSNSSIPSTNPDAYVSKLNQDGDFVWVKQFVSSSSTEGNAIRVDGSGAVYAAGSFIGTTDFDPGPGTNYLSATGTEDLYVVNLDSSGDFVWAQKVGLSGSSFEHNDGLAIDGFGNSYLSGYSTVSGSASIHLAKVDSLGNLVWQHGLSGLTSAFEVSIAAHPTGSVYALGSFNNTVDFDPGPGTTALIAKGARDTFIAKYSAGLDVLSVTRNDASPTNSGSVAYTVTFDDAVTGFDLSDLDLATTGTLSGTSITGLSGSGAVYTVTVATGSGAGTLRLDVLDDDSIINGASEPLGGIGPGVGSFAGETYEIDHAAPGAILSSTAADPTNSSPIPVEITFDESVTGFTSSDVTVSNGTVTNFTGSEASYALNITPAAQGPVTVQIGAAVCTDLVGNGNTASTELSRTYDSVPPTAVLTSSATSPTNLSPIPVNLTFGEPVPGHRLPLGISVTNGTLANFIDAGVEFSFDVIPSGQGTVSVEVFDWVCLDAAGNFNEGDTLVIVFDTLPPAITLVGDNPASAYLYAIYADAGATAFDAIDGDLTADIVSDTSAVNTGVPGAYTVTYDVSDSAGNPAHATRTVQVDGLDPSVPMDWRYALLVLSIAGIAALRRMKRQPK